MIELNSSLAQPELRERVFAGEILCFRQVPAIIEFCQQARSVAESTLACDDPGSSYTPENHQHWIEKILQYQLAAREHRLLKQHFAKTVEWFGFDLAKTFCDRFIFRVVPPENNKAPGRHSSVKLHRDSWGAGIYQQINWWGPVYHYPINTGIRFYPDYFDRAIANNTDNWNYPDFLAERKNQAAELKTEYSSVPTLLEQPASEAFNPQLEPGDLLCFSSVHLHGSNPNQSSCARFSFETRTVNLEDIRSGCAAPNHDNVSEHQMLRLFHNMQNGATLSATEFEQ